MIRNFYIGKNFYYSFNGVYRKANTPIGIYGLCCLWGVVKFASDLFFLMSKETYQEIKRISGEELRELLSDMDNVFDLGTYTLIGDSSLTSSDN